MDTISQEKEIIHLYGVELCLLEPNLLLIDFGTTLSTPELLNEVNKKIHRLWPGERMAFLIKAVSATDLAGLAREAENSVVTSTVIAAAFCNAYPSLTNSLVKVLGPFFLSFFKPPFPFRIFQDEEEALTWLRIKIAETS